MGSEKRKKARVRIPGVTKSFSRFVFLLFYFSLRVDETKPKSKMTEADAKDAFIIFDEAYEGNDVDAFYVPDILRALGCNCTNATCGAAGAAAALGEKRVTFEEFLPIWANVRADLKDTGCEEDYIEGLKVFDKDGEGKVPMAEVQNVLCSLGEKLDQKEAYDLFNLLGITEDEDGMISYMEFIDKLIAATS